MRKVKVKSFSLHVLNLHRVAELSKKDKRSQSIIVNEALTQYFKKLSTFSQQIQKVDNKLSTIRSEEEKSMQVINILPVLKNKAEKVDNNKEKLITFPAILQNAEKIRDFEAEFEVVWKEYENIPELNETKDEFKARWMKAEKCG